MQLRRPRCRTAGRQSVPRSGPDFPHPLWTLWTRTDSGTDHRSGTCFYRRVAARTDHFKLAVRSWRVFCEQADVLNKPDISQDLQLLHELNCEWEWSVGNITIQ